MYSVFLLVYQCSKSGSFLFYLDNCSFHSITVVFSGLMKTWWTRSAVTSSFICQWFWELKMKVSFWFTFVFRLFPCAAKNLMVGVTGWKVDVEFYSPTWDKKKKYYLLILVVLIIPITAIMVYSVSLQRNVKTCFSIFFLLYFHLLNPTTAHGFQFFTLCLPKAWHGHTSCIKLH